MDCTCTDMTDHDALTRECRVCLDGAEDDVVGHFISPCACTGSQRYIHNKCLARWRQENSGGVAGRQCQICREPYSLSWEHPEETLTIRLWSGGRWAIVALPLTVFVWLADTFSGGTSFTLLGQRDPRGPLLAILAQNKTRIYAYYYAYTTFLIGAAYYACVPFLVCGGIHRRCLYWKKMWKFYLCGLFLACSFIWLQAPSKLSKEETLFQLNLATIGGVLNLFIMTTHAGRHNTFVQELNTVYNTETVLSVPDTGADSN